MYMEVVMHYYLISQINDFVYLKIHKNFMCVGNPSAFHNGGDARMGRWEI